MKLAHEILVGQKSRRTDAHGSGQFRANRKGSRVHHGLDIEARAGESIMSPIDGNIVREAIPYSDDPNYHGIVIQGKNDWAGYEVKIFYARGSFCGSVFAGKNIGEVENLTYKYPGITNHIHLEIRKKGRLMDPFEIYQACF